MQRWYKKLLAWQIKNLLIQLKYVCNELKDENEIVIIRWYGYEEGNAKCYMITSKIISLHAQLFCI